MLTVWPTSLEPSLPEYLAGQRWFSGSEAPPADSVRTERAERLWSDGECRELWQVLVTVDDAVYQMLFGVRPVGEPADFLHGHENAVLGSTEGVYIYDAVWDNELTKVFLEIISGGAEKAKRARPMTAEQSNSSLVYDDRLILKLFRRLQPGRNPDVEMTTALANAGFDHVAAPLIEWRDDEHDLAFGQQFLAGGTDGWALALTSLRNLYTSHDREVPSEAGGDFAAEAARLGQVTGEMHVTLDRVFGRSDDGQARLAWVSLVDGLLPRLDRADQRLALSARHLVDRFKSVDHPGPAIRVHGDFHLGQVMRTDLGWYVLDFEGEPAKPVEERLVPASPMKDVTGMLRSFHYASRYALVERAVDDWSDMIPAAHAWETHNRQAFLEGYQSASGIADLLPDPSSSPAVIVAYELDKALYELEYERAYRPEWVSIPLDALERLVEGGGND